MSAVSVATRAEARARRRPRQLAAAVAGACVACAAVARASAATESAALPLRPSTFLADAAPAPRRTPSGFGIARELASLPDEDGTALRRSDSLSRGTAPRAKPPPALDARELRMASALALGQEEPTAPPPTPARTPPAAAGRSWFPDAEKRRPNPGAPGPLAQAAPRGSGPEEPVRPEDVKPGPPSPVSRESAPVPDLPDLSAITTWAIPPVRWGGTTSSNYSWNKSDVTKVFGESQGLSLRATSYIYQPWYAQVGGDIALVTGTSKQTSSGGGDTDSKNTAIGFGGNLSLFPQSRFPFQAYISSSDSRATANADTTQYKSMRIGARQSYRPETGPENYQASADRSIVTASNDIRSVVDAFQGSASTTFGAHALSGNARYSQTTGDVGGQASNLLAFTATHSWRDEEELSVASSATYSSNDVSVLGGSGLQKNNSQMIQANTSATWVPDEDLPLTIAGGGGFLNSTTKTDLDAASFTSFNGYANASYRFSPQLNGTAGLTLASIQAAGTSQFASGQTASVSYVGTPLTFGDFSYSWGTGAGVSNQIVSTGATSSGISAQAQHSIARTFTPSELSTLSLTASQGYSIRTSTGSGQSGVLTHSGGAAWRLGFSERTVGQLSVTATDSLSTGAFSSHFRTLSTQGNMQSQLSSRSALAANVNFIASQQITAPQATPTVGDPTLPPFQTSTTGNTNLAGSGQVAYSHRNPFDVTNLLYTASFQVNASQTNMRVVSGDPNALAWQTGTVLQQTADYRIGRLVFRATNSFATLNGKKNASIYFSISREIGDL